MSEHIEEAERVAREVGKRCPEAQEEIQEAYEHLVGEIDDGESPDNELELFFGELKELEEKYNGVIR